MRGADAFVCSIKLPGCCEEGALFQNNIFLFYLTLDLSELPVTHRAERIALSAGAGSEILEQAGGSVLRGASGRRASVSPSQRLCSKWVLTVPKSIVKRVSGTLKIPRSYGYDAENQPNN